MISESPAAEPTMHQRRGRLLIAVLSLVAAGAMVIAYDGSRATNDTAQYLSIAHNLAEGHGFATSIVYYQEELASGQMPAPETVFPPAYPLLTAGLMQLGLSAGLAAFVLALLCWGLLPLVMYEIAIRMGRGVVVAILVAIMGMGLVSLWYHVFARLSEVGFVLSTLLALLCLAGPTSKSTRMAFIAGACAALAFLFRYAGVFFIAGAALYYAIELVRSRSRAVLQEALAFGAVPAIALFTIFGRNMLLVGALKGGSHYPVDTSWTDLIKAVYRAMIPILGLSHRGLLQFQPGELVLLVVVLGALIFAVTQSRGVAIKVGRFAAGSRCLGIASAYILITCACLLYLEKTGSLQIGGRMFLPLLPVALLVVAELLSWVRFRSATARRGGIALLAGVILTFALGQVRVLAAYRTHTNPLVAMNHALEQPYLDTTIAAFLQQHANEQHPILGDEPQRLAYVLERPVVGLTPKVYTGRAWTADDVAAVVSRYHIEYIVVFPELLRDANVDERTQFLTQLADKNAPTWLTLLHDTEHVRLYRVKP